jgi:hypothetical protein
MQEYCVWHSKEIIKFLIRNYDTWYITNIIGCDKVFIVGGR